MRARLSGTAGAHRRPLSGRDCTRHRGAPRRPGAVAAIQAAIHRRQPAGWGQQCRDLDRRPRAGRRLHAPGRNRDNAINASLYESLDFNLTRDIAPVAGLVRLPLVLVVNPSVPAQTLGEFIAYAKANPGKLNYASVGSGAATNVAGELFKEMAGIDLVNVPYRGNYMPDRSAARSSRRSLRSSNRSSTARPASCGRWL